MSANRLATGLILVALFQSFAQAAPPKPWGPPARWWKTYVKMAQNKDGSLPEECLHALEGKPLDLPDAVSGTVIQPSGRDGKEFPRNQQASDLVDKAAKKLGIFLPPKHVEFVPSAELPQLAILGRPALGHWHDGSIIVKQASQAMGILEFVTPGCPTCRSFFSDSVTPEHQIEIFKHVAGHDSFSYTSMYCQIRQPCDPIAAAEHMFKFMEDAYQRYDADEVSQWYQYLLTLGSAQDFARGSFLPPDAFKKDSFYGTASTHPSAPTPHELQFTVSNLPESLPAWKKEMTRLFEEMERMKGFMVQTKITNEGWAFFMQDFLTPYLDGHYLDDHHVIESAILKSAVGPASLTNPYWLGREGWRNLRKRFESRVDIRDLDQFSKDVEFAKYAETIRQQYNDYDFLRLALDEDWIRRQGLFLYRKAEWNEMDPNLPPPPTPDLNDQKIVVSAEAKEVVSVIATRIADRSRQIPRVLLENENATARNVYSLAHEVVGDIPLDRATIGPSMYVRSQIWSKTVSLKTIASSYWTNPPPPPNPWWPQPVAPPTTSPIRIEVQPDGKSQVFKLDAEGKEVLDERLSMQIQNTVDAYREDMVGIVHDELEAEQEQRYSPFVTAIADGATRPAMNMLSHAPSSSTAILRYYQMLERRMYNSVMRAIRGKAKARKVKNGMRIKILPEIPEFALDRKIISLLDKHAPVPGQNTQTPLRIPRSLLDLVSSQHEPDFEFSPLFRVAGGPDSTAVDIGGGSRIPRKGDKFWGKPDNGQGDGDGDDGDGDGDDGDGDSDGNGKKPPKKPGKPGIGEGESNEIDIPLDLWGEFLKEDIELPNLRPKGGPTDIFETERDGARQHSQGDILWNRVMPRALSLGRLALKRKGIDPSKASPQRIMKEGLRYIQPSDWKVHDSQPIPLPDVNAVVALWMDMTGSMMGKPIEMAKQFTFNLKTLLATKYKNVKFVYIGFTTVAKVYDNEASFWRDFLNGGTDYNCGIEATREELAKYNSNEYDKFAFGIGDAEDGNGAMSSESLRALAQETQYSAFIQTQIGNRPDPTFIGTVREMAASDEFFGHAELTPQDESGIDVLKKILGKDRKK